MTFLDRWAPQLHAALRIIAALLFMEHGLMKLFHFPAAQPGAPTPLPMMLVVAAVLEVGGGALIALGLFTRLAAFICAGEMAVAYFMAHAPKGFWPALNGGEGAILFTFIFLFLAAAGPGAWSVDGTMGKRR
ncbi:MAG TPA: DoxX family protein [Sphingomonas sp.]|nr:DoxX family protein [Sphingomonas sp.]